MVETRGPLRSFVSVGLRLCRISSTMIVPPIRVEHSIRLKAAPTPFVQNKAEYNKYEQTVYLRTLKVHAQKCISGSTYWQSSRDCC